MMTLKKYELLGEHLKAIDPILEDFCNRTGFIKSIRLERYPRRYLVKYVDITLFFNLQMGWNQYGYYFEEFFPEIPYHYGFGGWIDIGKERYSKLIVGCDKVPFIELAEKLPLYLEQGYTEISPWNRELIISTGTVSSLS